MFETIGRINGFLARFGGVLQHVLLLAIRLFWGTSFFMTGSAKFQNIPQVMEYFEQLSIPFPLLNAYTVATIETVGGLCLALGFASRLATIPLVCVMTVALLTAHSTATSQLYYVTANLFSNLAHFMDSLQKVIQEAPFNYLLASLIVFCFGPGNISIDFIIGKIFGKNRR